MIEVIFSFIVALLFYYLKEPFLYTLFFMLGIGFLIFNFVKTGFNQADKAGFYPKGKLTEYTKTTSKLVAKEMDEKSGKLNFGLVNVTNSFNKFFKEIRSFFKF
jgi:hypothetical protein